MKTQLFILCLLWISISSFAADTTLLYFDFEDAELTTTGTAGEVKIGNILTKNYANGGGAIWDVSLDTDNPISGNKSVLLDITNNGTQFFALQFRLNGLFPVKNLYNYRVTYKLRSSVPNTVVLKCQVTAPNLGDTINLIGNDVIQTDTTIFQMNKTSENTVVVFFAFGPPCTPGKIWIDDFKIEEIDEINTDVMSRLHENIKIKKGIDKFRIESSEDIDVEVYNITGQKVFNSSIKSGISFVDLPQGQPFVIFRINTKSGESIVRKFKIS